MPSMYCDGCIGTTWHKDISRAYKSERVEVFKCSECKRNRTYEF